MPHPDSSSDFHVFARWEHGFSVSLTFTTERGAFGFLRALSETPRTPFRIVSAKAHRMDARGHAWDCPLPYCEGGSWFHGNGEPVADGQLPDRVPLDG